MVWGRQWADRVDDDGQRSAESATSSSDRRRTMPVRRVGDGQLSSSLLLSRSGRSRRRGGLLLGRSGRSRRRGRRSRLIVVVVVVRGFVLAGERGRKQRAESEQGGRPHGAGADGESERVTGDGRRDGTKAATVHTIWVNLLTAQSRHGASNRRAVPRSAGWLIPQRRQTDSAYARSVVSNRDASHEVSTRRHCIRAAAETQMRTRPKSAGREQRGKAARQTEWTAG